MERTAVIAVALSVALAGASAAVRNYALDGLALERRNQLRLDEDVLRSPGPAVLKIVSMEHAPAWADIFWLQIVQELGKPVEGEQASYDRLQRWADIAVDLDEKYFTVYWASAINLICYAKRAESAESLLHKGRANLPDRWEFPFLLGYGEFFLRGDPEAAALWWEVAVPLPDSPRFMPSLIARSRKFSGDERGAIEMLEMMLDTLEGPQREDAEMRLKILRSEIILGLYDTACQKFVAERGRNPVDGAELFNEKYVSTPPFDLFEKSIRIDGNCRARTEIIVTRDDEAQKMVGSQSEKALEGGR